MHNSIRALCAAATVLTVAGCGGGGYKSQPSAPIDGPPALSVVADQSMDQDTSTAPISFNVDDRESGAGNVVMSMSSSDTSIVAPEGMVVGGNGGSRTLTITPVESAFGTTSITMSARDSAGQSVTRTFGVTVKPVYVSFTRFTNDTYAVDENSDVRSLKGFTLDNDADETEGAFDALF